MELEEIQDVPDLLNFVRERVPSEEVVYNFAQAVAQVLQPFLSRGMRVFTSRGDMEIPEHARGPHTPAMLEAMEVIFHVSDFENPGFRFGVDANGEIVVITARDWNEPIDEAGPPPGTTIH